MVLKVSLDNKNTHVLESLFNKVAGLKACSLIKKRLQHKCLTVINAKVLRTAFFYRTPLVPASKFLVLMGKVNVEVSNFYQFCTPPPGFYGLALVLAI